MNTMTVTYTNEEGDEIEAELPAKKEVCPRCEGHGSHLNPSIGEHAYSMEEFHEAFDDEGRAEYFKRGGIYDVTCHECHGKNVITVIDEDACTTDEQKAHLAAWEREEEENARYESESRAEARMERLMCGDY